MRGLDLVAAMRLKAGMIPAATQNAAQFQRDTAMNYYMKAMEALSYAEGQTVHRKYVQALALVEPLLAVYRRHIRIADGLVRT